jgi:hypothetical protein
MPTLLIEALIAARKALRLEASTLPNQDAYAQVYSILSRVSEEIDLALKELPSALIAARQEVKNNPNQPPNRAIGWNYKP